MADPRSIHEFLTGEVEATTLLLGDFVDLDAQSGYTTYKMSVSDIGEVILEDIEYTQDLQTVDKTIIGAINENKSVIGYSYDEYDPTTAYSTGDLCIYNNTLYKAKQATTGNLPTNTTYWEQTSIADEINELQSEKASMPTSVSGVAYSNKIDSGNIYVYRIDRMIFVKAYLKVKTTLSDGDVILTGLPARVNYRADNTYPIEIGNEYFNSDSEMKGCYIDANNQLCIATASSIDNTRVLLVNFWYLSV